MILKVLGDKPAKRAPTFVLLGGGPASGKSGLCSLAQAEYPDAVVIDPDVFKLGLPEIETFRESDPLCAAARLHEESSYLAASALDAALLQRNDVIYDGVSGNPKKIAALIERLHQIGYTVHVHFVDSPLGDAMTRMAGRAKSTGRWVPPRVVEAGHYGAAATFFAVKESADTAQFWANGSQGPQKVAEYSKGKESVYDGDRYKEYREKADRHGRH